MSSENASDASTSRPGRPARLLLLGLEAYRALLSPLLGGHCRFWPSCSAYAEEAVRKHGAWRGARLTLLRLARCQPFSRGGIDPVP